MNIHKNIHTQWTTERMTTKESIARSITSYAKPDDNKSLNL